MKTNPPIEFKDSGQFSRRTFLRGSTALLALPWLESIPARSAETGKRTSARPEDEAPLRFACVFFSNGVEPEHWWAKGNGVDMELGQALAPLHRSRGDFSFLRGLYNEQAVLHDSAHLGRMPNLLSGAWVSEDQDRIRVGKTMDQLLAEEIGGKTRIPSLALGIEPTELRLEDGLSMLYGSNISWASESKPAMKEIYPARVYDLLVNDGKGRAVDQSILDATLEDAKRLRKGLAHTDQIKLDDYLDSVREIETRIQRASNEQRLEGWSPTLAGPNLPRPDESLPQDIPAHMKLMVDLIVLAFQMDKTRIATLMLNNDLSQMNFGFLEGVQGSLHLDLTHNGRDPELEVMYLKTNQFHLQQFAYLLERLKGIEEGPRTLLDNSMLLCCSNLFDGDKHQADEMPMLLAGRAGGRLETGRVLDYLDRGDENRRACGLYLSIMKHMGVELPRFGDATRPLAGV